MEEPQENNKITINSNMISKFLLRITIKPIFLLSNIFSKNYIN